MRHNTKIKPSAPAIQHQRYHPSGVVHKEFLRQPLPSPSPLQTNKNPIFKDIHTVLLVLKATGLLPIYQELSNYEVAPPTKQNLFYSYFIRACIYALIIFNLYSLIKPESAQLFSSYSDTDNVNKWIEFLLCILAHATTVVICAKNSKKILKIMNEILKVDEDIINQSGVRLHNKCGFVVWYVIAIGLCQLYLMLLDMFTTRNSLTVGSYIFFIFYSIQNSMSTIFIVFAASLLTIVRMRFVHLNCILMAYTYHEQKQKQQQQLQLQQQHQPQRGRFVDFARAAVVGGNGVAGGGLNALYMDTFPEYSLFTYRLHNKLLRIYRSINDCCSLILVAYMGYAFYTITTTTYDLFVQITTQRYISLVVLQLCFVWLIMHTSVLALLSRSCGKVTDEANETSKILARVYSKSKDHQNIVDKFLTKSIKQEVQFTAHGFFAIDNSTLFKIFSAVTTYLVILIQFKQLEDSKADDDTTT